MKIEDILLLDSSYYKESTNITEKFNVLADTLLNKIALNVNNELYRLIEIEFYLKTKEHPDPFIHGDKDQTIPSKWYFHRQNGGSYKGGTYKGVDITFGYKDTKDVYGGILIRSILDIKNNKLIEGSCKVVDYILKLCKHKNISDLTNEKQLSVIKEENSILFLETNNNLKFLEDNDNFKQKQMFSSSRVGLTLKNPSVLKEQYIMKDYRFLICADKIKKGVHNTVINMHLVRLMPADKLSIVMDMKEEAIKKIIQHAENGKSKNIKDYYSKKLLVIEWCELFGSWIEKFSKDEILTSVVNIKKENLKKLGYTDLQHWLEDPEHVYIGRDMTHYVKAATGSKWQNPFTISKYTREDCVKKYKEHVLNNKELKDSLHELKGKVLGCWCKPQSCHGDILIELINQTKKI